MSKPTHAEAARARAQAQGTDRTELRAALMEERRGYVVRGLSARMAQVDRQLKDLGPDPAPPTEPDGTATVPAPKGRRRGSAKDALAEISKEADAGEPAAAPAGEPAAVPAGSPED